MTSRAEQTTETQESGDQNSSASPFEVPFDNFKTKRRRTFNGRGKYFANVKQFFNGCKTRVRSLRDRRSMYDVGCQFVKKDESVVEFKGPNQETSTSFDKDSVIVRFDHKDVLVLDRKKDPNLVFTEDVDPRCYDVTTGLPETILEYLLETRLDNNEEQDGIKDTLIDDFLLTFPLFTHEEELCSILKRYSHGSVRIQHAFSCPPEKKTSPCELSKKRQQRLVRLVVRWNALARQIFHDNEHIKQLLESLASDLEKDNLLEELSLLEQVIAQTTNRSSVCNGSNDFISSPSSECKDGSHSPDKARSPFDEEFRARLNDRCSIRACDNVIFQVYRADHTYSKLRLKRDTTVRNIIKQCCEKWRIDEECVLCELKSNGEKQIFKYDDVGVVSRVSINGRLFVVPKDEYDILSPLPEQEGPGYEFSSKLFDLSAKDLAYHLTIYDNQLFRSICVYEFLYHVFGVRNFPARITTNLDLFLKRLDEIQYWVATELCLAGHLSKRVQLMKKFIKIAAHCKDYKNWNTFFAIILGLNNPAVSRMQHSWERLPTKFRKMYEDFESILNPSRNHRIYRLSMGSLEPPIIPFIPLFIKDMTFANEGSNTLTNEHLVNFTKMNLVASTLRLVQFCRSQPLAIEPPTLSKGFGGAYNYVRQLDVIDHQERLDQLSVEIDFKPLSPMKSQTL